VDLLDGEHGDYYIQEIFKFGDSIRLSETGYYVVDNRLDKIYRDGDSIRFELLEGQTFAVRDSFLTEAEIQDMVNKSWLLKDGGVPDNATDTVFRDGVAVIEGEVYDRYMTGDQDKYVWDGESDDPVALQ